MNPNSNRGFTLIEMVIGMTIMMILCLAFASLLKYLTKATVAVGTAGWAQEETRQALMKLEHALIHLNEVRVASGTFVEFVADMDQSPGYDPQGDADLDGIPNFRDGDRDADIDLLLPAAAQWRGGFNLLDDDEDGDLQIDVLRQLSLSNGEIWLDTSLNGAPWGGRRQRLATNVSTFTLAYFGNKAGSLGKAIDLGEDGNAGTGDAGENDGVISAREMDMALPPAGMGNRNGELDLKNERRAITEIRIRLGLDRNRDGKTDYAVETDVYPPLLPLKSQ